MKETLAELILLIRESGMSVWGDWVYKERCGFVAELSDRTGGGFEFSSADVGTLLAQLREKKIKRAKSMLDALDAFIRDAAVKP